MRLKTETGKPERSSEMTDTMIAIIGFVSANYIYQCLPVIGGDYNWSVANERTFFQLVISIYVLWLERRRHY